MSLVVVVVSEVLIGPGQGIGVWSRRSGQDQNSERIEVLGRGPYGALPPQFAFVSLLRPRISGRGVPGLSKWRSGHDLAPEPRPGDLLKICQSTLGLTVARLANDSRDALSCPDGWFIR